METLRVLVRGVHVEVDEGLRGFVEGHVGHALLRIFQQQARVVEVHLVDTNGPKGGVGKAARMTLRVPGVPAFHVEEVSEDVRKAVAGACERLERAAKHWLDKHHHHSGQATLRDLPVEEP